MLQKLDVTVGLILLKKFIYVWELAFSYAIQRAILKAEKEREKFGVNAVTYKLFEHCFVYIAHVLHGYKSLNKYFIAFDEMQKGLFFIELIFNLFMSCFAQEGWRALKGT